MKHDRGKVKRGKQLEMILHLTQTHGSVANQCQGEMVKTFKSENVSDLGELFFGQRFLPKNNPKNILGRSEVLLGRVSSVSCIYLYLISLYLS